MDELQAAAREIDEYKSQSTCDVTGGKNCKPVLLSTLTSQKNEKKRASLADSEDTGFASMASQGGELVEDDSDDEGTIVARRNSFSEPEDLQATSLPTHNQRKNLTLSLDSESPSDEDFYKVDHSTLRKTSSLKASKTPPGTPGRHKMVRFADTLGLDLASVRLMRDQEDPPLIPSSAFRDLRLEQTASMSDVGSLYLSPWFATHPGSRGSFIRDVLKNKVLLERVHVMDLFLSGTIRVSNIDYHKQVFVRYTTDGWTTQREIQAQYAPGSSVDNTDAFLFSLTAPSGFCMGGRLEFCIRYNVSATEFWDSNEGHNYVLECYARIAKVLPAQGAATTNNNREDTGYY